MEPLDHMPDDVQEGFECHLCDNPIPYLQEDIVVPLRVIDRANGDPMFLCNDCWETAFGGADPADVAINGNVAVIHAHA